MSESNISNNVEIKSSLITDEYNNKNKDKEEYHIKPTLLLEDNKMQENNKIETNNLDEEDDYNSLLTNINQIKSSHRIFELRLYLNSKKCFQLFKMNKIGKSYSFFYNKNDDPLIIIGPQWPYCIILFIASMLSFIFIYLYYNQKSTLIIKISDWLLFFVWSFSYFSMCTKNPGYPKMCPESIKGSKEMSYCDKCEIWYKPSSSTIHCEICDICIEGYTHHCFWTGHCIGGNNKIDFYFFLIMSFLFPIYLMANIAIIGKH